VHPGCERNIFLAQACIVPGTPQIVGEAGERLSQVWLGCGWQAAILEARRHNGNRHNSTNLVCHNGT
jgi:hypothetical protein